LKSNFLLFPYQQHNKPNIFPYQQHNKPNICKQELIMPQKYTAQNTPSYCLVSKHCCLWPVHWEGCYL